MTEEIQDGEGGERYVSTGRHAAKPLIDPLNVIPFGGLGDHQAPPGSPEGGEVGVIQSGWRLAWREFASNRLGLVGLGVVVFFLLFCFVGPLLYHTNQTYTELFSSDMPPSSQHLLGTDNNGFDELGRIMIGGRAALEISIFATAVAITIGTLYGALAGLIGGVVDAVLMRIVDVLLAIPFLLLILVLLEKYNGSVLHFSLVLGFFSWLIPARLIRGEVLTLRERDFVHAARVMGSGRWRLISRHLIPNALSVTVVNTTFLVADTILALATLGFLGFGLQEPLTSWGNMLGDAEQYVQQGYWWLVYPVGGCLVVLVLACNLVGNALRDATDVRLRRR